jgi:putative oxidoreductase
MNQAKLTNFALLLMRIGLGLVILYFGSQKVLGLFGGPGFQGTIQGMGEGKHIPPLFATLAMLGEFAGGLGLVLGLLTRVAAFGVMCTMAVATYFQATAPGAWSEILAGRPGAANQVFFPFLIFLFAFAILLMGAGPYSLDARFFGKRAVK